MKQHWEFYKNCNQQLPFCIKRFIRNYRVKNWLPQKAFCKSRNQRKIFYNRYENGNSEGQIIKHCNQKLLLQKL